MCTFSLLSSVLGQVNCVGEVRQAADRCKTIGNTCTVSDIVSRADEFVLNPPHDICLNKSGYFLALADFCAISIDVPGSSANEVIGALDKAIQFVAKSGEMKPELIQKGGEGALRMVQLYEYQSQIYLKQKDSSGYEFAIENLELWNHTFNGIKADSFESNNANSVEKRKDSLPVQTHVVYQPKVVNYIRRPVVVLAQSQEHQALLTDGRLNIQADPNLELIPSDHPKRFSYFLSFEEGQNYWVTLSHPDFEKQFFEFSTDQVPVRDTIFVIMYESGTPCFYTRYGKRAFVPDSSSILIIRNKYGSIEDFNALIENLGLQVDPGNRILYHKRSDEPFDSFNDPVLSALRKQYELVEAAGANLGTTERINVLTNRIQIIWNQKPSEMAPEEASQLETIFKEYQLKKIAEGLFEASPGIGLGLNDIVEKLNGIKAIRLTYLESFQPIYPK